MLVPIGSPVHTVDDLAGKTVCATRGSTSITKIQQRVPTAKIYPVDTRADCLVALQDGEVDAITSDDTILTSFQAQEEPSDTRPPRPITGDEPYAIAMPKGHEDLVRFVNARARAACGTTARSSCCIGTGWVRRRAAAPPAPGYGR